jgi:hypothetical protein
MTRTITRFFIALALIGLSAGANAQPAVMSGSFQFTNTVNKRVGIITLQLGTQRFEMPISENIIIANLLPGRYTLTVEFQNGGRGGRMTQLSQIIEIESERRTICRMNASAVLTFAKEYDRSSMPIMANNFRDRHDFDNMRVVAPPPPHNLDDMRVVALPPPHNLNDIRVVEPPQYGIADQKVVPMPLSLPPQIISDYDFNKLYNAMKDESFSDTKMRTLKTSSNFYEFFSSEQVKRLALLFTYDNDKLECVKHLALKVLDVHNLPYIQEIFSFKSTKDDYLKFLNKM